MEALQRGLGLIRLAYVAMESQSSFWVAVEPLPALQLGAQVALTGYRLNPRTLLHQCKETGTLFNHCGHWILHLEDTVDEGSFAPGSSDSASHIKSICVGYHGDITCCGDLELPIHAVQIPKPTPRKTAQTPSTTKPFCWEALVLRACSGALHPSLMDLNTTLVFFFFFPSPGQYSITASLGQEP